MNFTPLDLAQWERREHFGHYLSRVPCTYSATFSLDVTRLRAGGKRFYPAMLHHIAAVVNAHREFRMALDEAGRPGFYDVVHPCYTIFHKDTETFSNLWTEYQPSYEAFLAAWLQDNAEFGGCHAMEAKPGTPPNTFPVSMIPWASFEGFNLNLEKGYDYLPPIFTMGRFFERDGRVLVPLAVQVHHAVCDGFHLCRLVNELQDRLDREET